MIASELSPIFDAPASRHLFPTLEITVWNLLLSQSTPSVNFGEHGGLWISGIDNDGHIETKYCDEVAICSA